MQHIFYKGPINNFGDDLNPWLWEKLFGDFSLYDDRYSFMGIGSMLDKERIESDSSKKIIFGSGVRDFLYDPNMNFIQDIRFVRGPISSKVFGNAPYITDAAYCLALLKEMQQEEVKKYKVAFVPYFRHCPFFNWSRFEKLTGIKVILPTNPIEQVIQEIKQSERILAAAMHGAILADIFRIPWARIKFREHGFESPLTSEIKWYDWHKSVELETITTVGFGFSFTYKAFFDNLIKGLILYINLKRTKYTLSSDSIFEKKITDLAEEVDYFKSTYIKNK